MRTLLPLLLLCACAGSLVDHAGASLSNPDGGSQACLSTCTTDVAGATIRCDGDVCTYQCPAGKFKAAGGCHEAAEISGGASHTCAVVSGEARCWGANDKGQLGRDIPATGSFIPTPPAGLPPGGIVSHIAAGAAHSCAIVDGNVWCWGDNGSGQLGNGMTAASTAGVAYQVANIAGAQLIAAGGAHTCAANASKTFCWGNNNLGQLGDGANIPEAPRPEATEVPGAAGALALAAGDSHTCAITSAGVRCWGANGAGQLGNNTTVAALSTPGATSPALTGASFLGLGLNHSCAVVTDSLSCWGANGAGQIDNSLQDQRSPRGVLSNVRAVTGGTGHTCAITKSQTLRCWGLDSSGQLGAPGQSDVSVNLTSVSVAAAGAQHTCATADLLTYCWGANDRGQLGVDPHVVSGSTATPSPISGL